MTRLTIIVSLILLSLIPLIPVTREYRYSTLEPYAAYETVQVPYQEINETAQWQPSEAYQRWKNNWGTTPEETMPSYYGLGSQISSGHWVVRQQEVTRFRPVSKPVTKYMQVWRTSKVEDKVSFLEWFTDWR